MRTDREETGDERLARIGDRAARHHDAARGISAGGVGGGAGIAEHDPDVGDVDAHDLVCDLSERRLHALAMGVYAGAAFEPSIRRHAHRRLVVAGTDRQAPPREHAGAVRGLLAIRGKPNPDQSAIALSATLPLAPRFEADLFAREDERLAIVAAVVVFARHVVVGHVGGRNEIVVTDLPRLATDRARDRVDHQLHGKTNAGAGYAAVGQEAGLVRRHAPGLAAVAAEVVRP